MGVAVARAERDRRAGAKRRRRERRFGMNARERPGEGLRRISLGQLDVAIEALRGGAGSSPERRVHEARKALKRLRALLRLLEDELGERAYEHESAVVREVGRRLAQARDAEVLLSTLDGLIERDPKRLGARGGVQRLRGRLQSERDGAAQRALSGEAHGGAVAELLGLRARVETWELSHAERIEALEPALARIYGTGRRRMRRAAGASDRRSQARRLHEWRKRVKDLRYVAEALDAADARGADKRARARAAFLGKVARRADDLGETLGEEHDLAVLAGRVRDEARTSGTPGRSSRKALLKAIARRRKRLQRRALRLGARLYRRRRKRFARRVRAAVSRR